MARKKRNTMTLETYNVFVRMEDEDKSIKKISGIVDLDRQKIIFLVDRLCRQMKKEVIP